MKLDKGFCVVFASAALALGSFSFVFCPTAHAGSPVSPHAPSEAAQAPLATDLDDDKDELLEHWGDTRYSREERVQLAGIAVLLTFAGAGAAWRRRTLRRSHSHA